MGKLACGPGGDGRRPAAEPPLNMRKTHSCIDTLAVFNPNKLPIFLIEMSLRDEGPSGCLRGS